jgi:hypothetical protein
MVVYAETMRSSIANTYSSVGKKVGVEIKINFEIRSHCD